jgi:hypothetical protein
MRDPRFIWVAAKTPSPLPRDGRTSHSPWSLLRSEVETGVSHPLLVTARFGTFGPVGTNGASLTQTESDPRIRSICAIRIARCPRRIWDVPAVGKPINLFILVARLAGFGLCKNIRLSHRLRVFFDLHFDCPGPKKPELGGNGDIPLQMGSPPAGKKSQRG